VKIVTIAAGELDTDESVVFAGGDSQKSYLLYCYIHLVIGCGQAFVVDTGFGDFDYCQKFGKAVCRLRNNNIVRVLQENGYRAEDITSVVLTHCHWDHIGGLSLFPNATIYCQRQEYECALANSTPDSGQYPLAFKKYLIEAEHRFRLIEGVYQLNPNVKLKKTGGHSVGSQIIEIENDDESALILGDEVFYFDNITRNIPVGCTINPEKSRQILDYVISRINNSAKKVVIYPGHDPKVEML
jgi:glyoxylase-like metal-dependent hydrolase (beta-lactamase superfamily II)